MSGRNGSWRVRGWLVGVGLACGAGSIGAVQVEAGGPPASRDIAVQAAATADAVTIDGRLDDEAWRQAPVWRDFSQRAPDEGAPATERTELRLLYDTHALYVGARLYDRDPAAIVRRLSRRDLLADADQFSIYLDPQHDRLTGVAFRVSAAGVQQDSLIYNDTFLDDSWDAVWTSAVAVDGEGWSVEMRIPFSQLRFPRDAAPTVWGVNAERVIQRRNEGSWLAMVPRRENGLASRMARLEGLDHLAAVHHLELLPYSSVRGEMIRPLSAGDPFNDGSRGFASVGMDLKYRLSNSLTLDATVNPDFGQVEVDPAVVNLTAFETFYEEKRPFFVTGNPIFKAFGRGGAPEQFGYFRTEPDLFYSRRIGRAPQGTTTAGFVDRPTATTILGAGKITGRTRSGWTIGALEAVTGSEWARVENRGVSRQPVEPLTNYLALRASRELGRRGGVGLLTTAVHRDLPDGSLSNLLVGQAYVAGGDGHYFFDGDREWVVTGQLSGSLLRGAPAAIDRVWRAPVRYLQRPDAPHIDATPRDRDHLAGWTGHVDVNRNAGNVLVNGAVWGTSPGFDANDLGFMYQADRAGGHGQVIWRKTTPDRFTRARQLLVSKWWTWNWGRESQGDGVQAQGTLELLNYWKVTATGSYARRTWDDRLTRGGPSTIRPGNHGVAMTLASDVRRTLSLTATGNATDREFGGWSRTATVSANFKPATWLSLSAGPSLLKQHNVAQYVRSVADPLAVDTYGGRYVFADLEQTEIGLATRLNWVLSPRLSLQIYAQPLLSVGEYSQYKELARPKTYDFRRYGIEAGTLVRDGKANVFVADPDGDGPALPFTFAPGDFNFKSLRVNSILRWEWRPGSTLYVAWTQQRQDLTSPGDLAFGRDIDALASAPADDVVMVKVTYWLGR
jgi:hypothetical protein